MKTKMKMTPNKFADYMLSDIKSESGEAVNRLDDVAEMVSQMEKKLTDKIDAANKALIERMESNPVTEDTTDEIIEEKESNYNEDNGSESISTQE